MAIVTRKPDAPLPTQPSLPRVEPERYSSIINDDRYIPSVSLIAYIEGMPWSVTYYQQVISKHNDLRELDSGQLQLYQQYHRINKLELRVDSELNSTHNSETSITSVTGSGLLYPFIVPNVADYFTADTGGSNTGLYRITSIDRKSFNKESVFSIEYDLVGYIDDLDELYTNLQSKVIREYHFHKDRLVEGLQPLLRSEEHNQVVNLNSEYRELVKHYFKTFFNRKYMTIVVPGQTQVIYDSYLVDYLMMLVDTSEAPEIRLVKQLTKDNDPYLKQPQFWNMLLDRDYSVLPYCHTKMGLVTKYSFNNSAFLHGFAFTNMQYMVYPISVDTSASVASSPIEKTIGISDIIDTNNALGNIGDLFNDRYTDALRTYIIADYTLADEYYVLSKNFYTNTRDMSLLEVLTKDYIKRQTIDQKKLLVLLNKYQSWNRLEQYYYGPILITLIKSSLQDTYS